jgi:carotenoid cleavage dioxygenase-like enzyme
MNVERDPAKRVNRARDILYCQVEVDLVEGTVVNKRRSSGRGANGEIWGMEMPRYNDEWQGKKNCFVYGITAQLNKTWQKESQFIMAFGKANICLSDVSGNIVTYAPELHYAWEPVFVPNGGPAEDDGVLLIVSMDAKRKTSYVLIMDAKDMTELAVAYLPEGFVIPNGLHSRFFPYAEFPLPSIVQTLSV